MAVIWKFWQKIFCMRRTGAQDCLCTEKYAGEQLTFYEKMEVLEKQLGEGFFRSHPGFLVNLREVYKYDATTIQMKNGDKVYLAKQKYNDFVTAYMKYLRAQDEKGLQNSGKSKNQRNIDLLIFHYIKSLFVTIR